MNATAIATNEAGGACMIRTTLVLIYAFAHWIAAAETRTSMRIVAAVHHAITVQYRLTLSAVTGGQETWVIWLSTVV